MASIVIPLERRSNPLRISGIFDIYGLVPAANNRLYGPRESQTSIACSGLNNNDIFEYPIVASTYGPLEVLLKVDGLYALHGKLLALNTPDIQKLYYSHLTSLSIVESSKLRGDLTNKTSVIGMGLVVSKSYEQESIYDQPTLLVVLRHNDYNPSCSHMVNFTALYRMPPTRPLIKPQALVQVNREIEFTGFIKHWDPEFNQWVIEVTDIVLTSGPQTSPAINANAPDPSSGSGPFSSPPKTPSSRVRGRFYAPPQSHDHRQTDSVPPTPDIHNPTMSAKQRETSPNIIEAVHPDTKSHSSLHKNLNTAAASSPRDIPMASSPSPKKRGRPNRLTEVPL